MIVIVRRRKELLRKLDNTVRDLLHHYEARGEGGKKDKRTTVDGSYYS